MTRRALALFLLVLALGPAVARADTYCVNATGCDHAEGNDLQQALDHAQSHAGPDTVRLGPNAVTNTGGYMYPGPDPVYIEGSGGRGSGASLIEDQIGAPSSETVLTVFGTGSTISGVAVLVPGGSDNVGIETNGAISNVVVYPKGGSDSPTGVVLDSGATLADSDVLLPTSTSGVAVVLAGSDTTVTDSRLSAADGYEVKTGVGAGATGLVRRTRVEFGAAAFFVKEGTVAVEDSLLVSRADNSFSPHFGIQVNSTTPGTSVSANHVTLIGPSGGNSTAMTALASGVSNSAAISFRNGIITGFPNAFNRTASTGTANITTDFSDYGGTTFADTGAGSITETNHLDVDPRLVGPYDFSLRSDSPLVDAGDPAGLAAGESTTDLAGQPRVVDGNGDCAPRVDIGAYELNLGPHPPRAAAKVTPARVATGKAVTFDASGSCDEDGDQLTFSWAFDDGSFSAGPKVQHTFTRAGLHLGTVTVTDGTGRSSTATAPVVLITPPPPFGGVTIAKQTVRVTTKGVARVRVKCPSAARGSCAGTLRLSRKGKGLGSRKFSIKPGAGSNVGVQLSKATRTRLRTGRLTVTATAVATDSRRKSRTTVARITLR